ncbi:hypothetical protein [Halobacillus campisalis]|uniref:Uncharacterized protein n=1 Tax=Halobacillus campisalis TaxID=435909 RepID=A0ABW2K7U2_9BACI
MSRVSGHCSWTKEMRRKAFKPETHKQDAAIGWPFPMEVDCLCREGLPFAAGHQKCGSGRVDTPRINKIP